ncbi:DUF4465 domain-containing protein [Pontiellaceae bacterium B12219]|nr:DUF4465 domain-containing protein [Pontiellaceae bacterium B12219]
MKNVLTVALCAAVAGLVRADMTVVDFDGLPVGPQNYYMTSDQGISSWSDSGATFNINYDTNYSSWDGITYSKVNNPNTGGYENQYAVYGGGTDKSGAGSYAIAYYSTYSGAPNTTIRLDEVSAVNGFYINNTAFTADAIFFDGFFESAFTTNDWLKLTVEGFNGGAESQGSVDFMLADFTGYSEGDNKQDYLISDWSFVDLSGLGSNVSALAFSVSSSNPYTPSYFAMDELSYAAVPEPSSVILMIGGFGGIVWFRHRRKYFFRG